MWLTSPSTSAPPTILSDPDTGVPVTGRAFNRVTAGPGVLNLGANLGAPRTPGPAHSMEHPASGIANSHSTVIGNRNTYVRTGVLANSTVVGMFLRVPERQRQRVTSTGPVTVAFVRQGVFTDPCVASAIAATK